SQHELHLRGDDALLEPRLHPQAAAARLVTQDDAGIGRMGGAAAVGFGSPVHPVDQLRFEIELGGEQVVATAIPHGAAARTGTTLQHHHVHVHVAAVVPARKDAAEGHHAILVTDAGAAAE